MVELQRACRASLWLCHRKLRLPAILTASQKCSCEQAFLLHGGIAVKATPVYIRFVENNFAFSAVRKKHKDAFLFSYFSMTKSTKSHLRGRSSLLKNTLRVHELVARSSAWQVRATNGRAKVYSFALPAISIIPRVRTYHTKKPSRFVHALSARPLKVHWRA